MNVPSLVGQPPAGRSRPVITGKNIGKMIILRQGRISVASDSPIATATVDPVKNSLINTFQFLLEFFRSLPGQFYNSP
jgi:hypothetical protein